MVIQAAQNGVDSAPVIDEAAGTITFSSTFNASPETFRRAAEMSAPMS